MVRGDVDAMVRSEWVCGLIATKKFSDAVRSELGQLGEGLALRFNEAVEVDIRNNIAFGLSSFLEDTPWCTLSPSPNDPTRLSICLSEDFEVEVLVSLSAFVDGYVLDTMPDEEAPAENDHLAAVSSTLRALAEKCDVEAARRKGEAT